MKLPVIVLALVFLSCTSVDATEPTFARLSFWLPPERMAEFEAAYYVKVVPILKRHGLMESSQRGRATPDSVFSRLFELKAPSEVSRKQASLDADEAWKALLQVLGGTFGAAGQDSLIRHRFELYTTPAGPGRTSTPSCPRSGRTASWSASTCRRACWPGHSAGSTVADGRIR